MKQRKQCESNNESHQTLYASTIFHLYPLNLQKFDGSSGPKKVPPPEGGLLEAGVAGAWDGVEVG